MKIGVLGSGDVARTLGAGFLCGNDEGAKRTVSQILDHFGWEPLDMGGMEAARAIEPLSMLWCVPGFLRNDWSHAFKLLHTDGGASRNA